jgi:hypothetical protein
MDNLTQQKFKATADTAQADDIKNTAAAELGKFKDVKALMEAYSNLEAEFTRRSQRLKELENAIKEQNAPATDGNANVRQGGDFNGFADGKVTCFDGNADSKATDFGVNQSGNADSKFDGNFGGNANGAASAQAPSQEQKDDGEQLLLKAAMNSDLVKNAVISEYLQRAAKNKGVPFITGGGYVAAQRAVPSSVKEAGKLAQQFLINK